MSTTEYQQRIAAMVSELKGEAPAIALRMAQTGLTLQKKDIIEKGITVDGSFAEYSDKQVYKSSLKKTALNAAGSAYASSGGKGNYKGLRAAQGMKTDHVNMFYQGRTLAALRITAQTQVGYRYSVLVGCTDDEATKILLENLKRYGNFLKLDDDRVKVIQSDGEVDVRQIISKYL